MWSYDPYETDMPVQCICKQGYVGNGTLCNGDTLETLASIPVFTHFYKVRYMGILGIWNLEFYPIKFSRIVVFLFLSQLNKYCEHFTPNSYSNNEINYLEKVLYTCILNICNCNFRNH